MAPRRVGFCPRFYVKGGEEVFDMFTNRGSLALAFLLGGAIGAGIALLYAPTSGEETRKRLKKGVEDTSDWLKGKYGETKGKVEGSAEQVKKMVEEKKADLKAAYDAGRDAYLKSKDERGQRQSA